MVHAPASCSRKPSGFGATASHRGGAKPLLIAETLHVQQLTAALNYGLNKVRFPTPVPVGSRLRGVVTLAGAQQRPAGIEAVFTVVYELQGSDRPACVAEFVAIYR